MSDPKAATTATNPKESTAMTTLQATPDSPTAREWLDLAYDAIDDLSHTGTEFSADDLRLRVPTPPHPNLVGIAFRSAHHNGLIRSVGYGVATATARRGGSRRVWVGMGEAPSSVSTAGASLPTIPAPRASSDDPIDEKTRRFHKVIDAVLYLTPAFSDERQAALKRAYADAYADGVNPSGITGGDA